MKIDKIADIHRMRAEAELALSLEAASAEAAFAHSALAELHRQRAAKLAYGDSHAVPLMPQAV